MFSLISVLSLGLMTKDPLNSYLFKLIDFFQHEYFSERGNKKYLADIGHLALKCETSSLHLF